MGEHVDFDALARKAFGPERVKSDRSNLLRCRRCRLHVPLCMCSLLPRLETRTRLVLVIHRIEDRKSTNTGRLATECLPNSEVIIRGHVSPPSQPLAWDPASTPVFLFPSDDAIPLADVARTGGPVTLVVPDGTWRQASKVRHRLPGLVGVPCVTLPPGEPTTYRLRSVTHAERLSTLEAIARAMGVLEGEAVQRALERVFRVAVERALWARGDLRAEDVSGGIPTEARMSPRPGE